MSETPKTWRSERVLGLCALVLLLVVGGGIGCWAYGAVRQREAVAELTDHGGDVNTVSYDWQVDEDFEPTLHPSPQPAWLRQWLGMDYLATVRAARMYDASDDKMRLLKQLPGLRSVAAAAQVLTDEGMAELKDLPRLERLTLSGSGIVTADGLAVLSDLTHLRILELDSFEAMNDAIVDRVSRLTNLRRLVLVGESAVTNAGLAHLARLTNLERLMLDFVGQRTDAALERLQHLPRLRRLELVYEPDSAVGGHEYLAGFPSLEELELQGELPTRMLADLPVLPGLHVVSLASSQTMTSAGVESLQKQPNLRELVLRDLSLDAELMAQVATLSNLTKLTICDESNDLTDDLLEPIGRMSNLRQLHIDPHAYLTDAGLAHLSGLTGLEELRIELNDVNQFSPAARKALHSKLPHSTIIYVEPIP